MPFGMSGPIQSTVIQDKIYIGGGIVDEDENKYVIMVYDFASEEWNRLPPYELFRFAMAALKDQLVLVGGYRNECASRALAVWREDLAQWTHPYPEMHSARCRCSVAAYDKWLVVCGGVAGGALSSVEVLDTDTNQWLAGPPLPVPMCQMKTALVGDVYYSMGGLVNGIQTDRVYSVSIPALIRHIKSEADESGEELWKVIPGLKLEGSAPLALKGSLFAVGGEANNNTAVTAIHVYKQDTMEWEKVGHMPTARCFSTSKYIPEKKEIFVFGGWQPSPNNRLKSVHISTVQ